ncbi:DUF6643 family protein [Streptomyces sp. NBC_01190]|uniref:DUF6643 family protein n=1 Tax=Streptomyces sp. NBC_01190 TaxID=2903767 RepID=UPI00386B533F|nr:hypothetical protein OG519_33230 [Streptomyces sp. NBC_01190]
MTTPRGSYGGGYGGYYPSSSSFPDTPIYDSLVAERGTPQIAPIRVPSAYTPYESGSYNNSYGGGSNLPALPAALPALPPGPSAPSQYPQAQPPMPNSMQHSMPSPAQSPMQSPTQNGYQQGGYPQQQQPTAYIPQQAPAPRTGYNGYGNGGGYQGAPQQAPQPAPTGYEAARPVPPRPTQSRQMPGGHPEEQYPRRNLGLGVPPQQQGGGYYQG